jgi:hypothetical protein
VACSFIASGLRVFDISKITAPKEIAYFVAPPTARVENGGTASNFAMSQPTFAPDRREIWFTEGETGFYALRVAKDVWPTAAAKTCKRTKSRTVKVPGKHAVSITAHLTKGGRGARGAVVRLRGPGFKRQGKTGRGGRVTFKVHPERRGRATVSTSFCGGKLSVEAEWWVVRLGHDRDPSFTG